MSTAMSTDMFICLTDPAGKHPPIVNQHRVWDRDKFFTSQVKQYMDEAKPEEMRIVTLSTREQYVAQRKKVR